VTDQTPPSASRSPDAKVFKVFVEFGATVKAKTVYNGEVIGRWYCPIQGAARWLLARGLASKHDVIDTWREGRGRPDYFLLRSTIGRASALHFIEGEAIYTEGEWLHRESVKAREPVEAFLHFAFAKQSSISR